MELSLSNIPPMQVSVGVLPTRTAQEMKLQWQTKEAVVWKNILVGCSKTLCLVYVRKGRLYGEHANVHQSHSQNDSGDLRGVAGGDGELVW